MKNRLLTSLLLCFALSAILFLACTHEPPTNNICNLHLNYVATPDVAGGSPDGNIVATAEGGTGFMFSINNINPQASGTFTGLVAGTYKIVVTNDAGCKDSANVIIDEIPNPCGTINVATVVSNPTVASPNSGSIVASASGAAGPWTYSIDGTTFSSNNTFSNLTAGNYTITAKNGGGCTGTASVTLSASNPCTGVTITVGTTFSNPTTAAPMGGSITAIASGGTGPYTYALSGTSTGSNSTGSFTGLGAGTYTVTATSSTGCTGTSTSITLAVGAPCTALTVTGTPTRTSTICATDGTITASASGGTAPYTYSKNGTTFQATGSFTALATGTVTITAKDVNGCTGTTTVTVSGPATVSFATDIKPIVSSSCGPSQSCHNHNSNWTTYSDIVGTSTGTTWSSNLSTFLKRIRSTTGTANSQCPLTTSSGNHNMPPSSSTTWTNFVKGALTNWVDQGYPNN